VRAELRVQRRGAGDGADVRVTNRQNIVFRGLDQRRVSRLTALPLGPHVAHRASGDESGARQLTNRPSNSGARRG
jgi:hypothetical protein